MGAYHSTDRPEAATLRAIFIAPTKGGCHSSCRPETGALRAIFIAPTKLRIFYRFLTQKRYRVGQGTHVWEPAQCVTKSVTKKLRRQGCG